MFQIIRDLVFNVNKIFSKEFNFQKYFFKSRVEKHQRKQFFQIKIHQLQQPPPLD